MEPEHPIQNMFFRTAMWWRIGYGVVRILLGLILLKAVGTPVSEIFYTVMHHELTRDPNDILIQAFQPLVEYFPITITYFAALYFLFWGLLDVILSILLLRHKLWAFPLSILLIVAFVVYELYRFTHTHSPILLGVIFIDVLVIGLIYREYKNHI